MEYHILVAEGHQVNQLVAKGMLLKLGCRVTVVGDGVKALLCLQQDETYDLVLLDFHLPKLNGIQVARRIRETMPGFSTPLVAISAVVTADNEALASEVGIAECIEKPITPAHLQAALNKHLDHPSEPVFAE